MRLGALASTLRPAARGDREGVAGNEVGVEGGGAEGDGREGEGSAGRGCRGAEGPHSPAQAPAGSPDVRGGRPGAGVPRCSSPPLRLSPRSGPAELNARTPPWSQEPGVRAPLPAPAPAPAQATPGRGAGEPELRPPPGSAAHADPPRVKEGPGAHPRGGRRARICRSRERGAPTGRETGARLRGKCQDGGTGAPPRGWRGHHRGAGGAGAGARGWRRGARASTRAGSPRSAAAAVGGWMGGGHLRSLGAQTGELWTGLTTPPRRATSLAKGSQLLIRDISSPQPRGPWVLPGPLKPPHLCPPAASSDLSPRRLPSPWRNSAGPEDAQTRRKDTEAPTSPNPAPLLLLPPSLPAPKARAPHPASGPRSLPDPARTRCSAVPSWGAWGGGWSGETGWGGDPRSQAPAEAAVPAVHSGLCQKEPHRSSIGFGGLKPSCFNVNESKFRIDSSAAGEWGGIQGYPLF